MSANPAPAQNDPTPAPAPVKTYTEAELNERIEAARKEEKTKLYSEIDSLKTQLKDYDLTKNEREQLQQKLKEAEGNLNALNAARKGDGIDPLLLAKQVAEDTRKVVVGEYDGRFTQMEKQLNEANERARKQELANHRQRLISEAQGKIIPAMVVGNTVEELNASAEESKRQYAEIANQHSNPNPAPAPVNPPPPVNPRAANGGSGNPPATGVDAFKRGGDPAAYRQNRTKLLAELRQQHG